MLKHNGAFSTSLSLVQLGAGPATSQKMAYGQGGRFMNMFGGTFKSSDAVPAVTSAFPMQAYVIPNMQIAKFLSEWLGEKASLSHMTSMPNVG